MLCFMDLSQRCRCAVLDYSASWAYRGSADTLFLGFAARANILESQFSVIGSGNDRSRFKWIIGYFGIEPMRCHRSIKKKKSEHYNDKDMNLKGYYINIFSFFFT